MRLTLLAIVVLILAVGAYFYTEHHDYFMASLNELTSFFRPSPPPVAAPPKPVAAPPPVKEWRPPVVIPSQANWTWTTSDGKTYQNVKIVKIEADSVTILDADGGALVPIATLPASIQKQLDYDPAAAARAAAERTKDDTASQALMQQENQARDQIHAVWSNFQQACDQARAEKKNMLLYFTGSDWSPSCQQLESEVLSTEEFEAFCGANFVFVTVDFPKHSQLPMEEKAQNEDLQKEYAVSAYPALIVVTPDGKKLDGAPYHPVWGVKGVIASLRPFTPAAIAAAEAATAARNKAAGNSKPTE